MTDVDEHYGLSKAFKKEIANKVKKIEIPIWERVLWITVDPEVCFCIDSKFFRDENEAAGSAAPIGHPQYGEFFLVWGDNMSPSTIVHELTHVALMVLEDAGVELEGTKGEPLCYLIGYLYKQCESLGLITHAS